MIDPDPILPPEALLEHQGWLRALARRLVQDDARADDVMQQAWLAALRSPPAAGPGIRGWLATVVRNTAAKLRREEERRDHRELRAAATEAMIDTAVIVEELHAQREVVDAVLRLDEPYRTVVLLRFFRNQTPTEIAHQLGEKVSTVKTRLRRAIERLRERLDATHGGDRRSWCLALLPVAAQDVTAGATTLIGGGLVLKSATKFVLVVVLTLVTAGVAWELFSVSGVGTPDLHEGSRPAASKDRADIVVSGERDAGTNSPDTGARRVTVDASPSDDEPPRGHARLRIRDDAGRPAAGAQVILVRDGVAAPVSRADEAGEVLLDPNPAIAEAYVFWSGAPPHHESLALTAGDHDLSLPRGAVVAGRVLVDGAAPDRPVTLRLTSDRPFASNADFPPGVISLLQEWGIGPSELEQTTDADGRFSFTGLPRDFRGQFLLPAGEFDRLGPAVGDSRWIDVLYPREDFVLELVRRPALVGRALDSEGRPVPAGFVVAQVFGTGASFTTRVPLDAFGRFEVPLRDERTNRVQLQLASASGAQHRDMELEGNFSNGRDLGDVQLHAPRTLRFEVQDTAGRPIAGARAYGLDPNRPPSAPTDDAGVGDYEISEVDQELWIAATSYDIEVIHLPRVLDGVWKVKLQSAATLDVHVVDERGSPAEGVTIHLSAGQHFLTDPGGFAGLRQAPDGFDPIVVGGGWGTDAGMQLSLQPVAGRARIQRIQSGVPIRVVVIDELGGALAQEVVTLGKGEARSLTFEVPAPSGPLRGTVRDPDGAAIGEAVVFVSEDGVRNTVARTDSFGEFEVSGVRAETVRVMVRRRYYVSCVIEGLRIPEAGLVRDFTLARAVDLDCHVRDQNGRVFEGVELSSSSNDRVRDLMDMHFVVHTDAKGWGRLDDLPLGRVTVRALVAGRTYEFQHDTTNLTADLVLPAHGAAEILFDRPFHESLTEHRLRYLPRDGGAAVIDDSITVDPDAPSIRHTTLALLPGTYRVELERLSDQDWESYLPVAGVDEVTIAAVATTKVRLEAR